MKVSYSKLLVQGVIATTLLMSMSCQKKGSARGIQPQTATKAESGNKEAPEANPNLGNLPDAKDQTLVEKDEEKTTPAPKKADAGVELAGTTSGDNSPAETEAKKENAEPKAVEKASTPTDKGPEIPEGQVGSASNPKLIEEVVIVVKECSDDMVKAATQMTSLYNKIVAVDKVSTTPEADRIANYTAYQQMCLDWTKRFDTENIKSCGKGGNVTKQTPAESCIKYAFDLKDLTGKDNTITLFATKARNERMASLRAAKLVISEEAKEMFAKENTNWNTFIVDGEIKKEKSVLFGSNKVACTVAIASLDKYTDAQNVVVNVTAATELLPTDAAEPVQKGVELAIRIKATAKDATAEEVAKASEEKSVILCSNLDAKNINTKLLSQALGKHIAVAAAAPKATEATQAEEKAVEKTEPTAKVKQK